MAVYKPLVLGKDETDINKIMNKLYRFSRDLKFTIANLSLEDNIDNSVLDVLDNRDNKMRQISFSADGLTIDLKDYETGMHTSLEQTSEKITLLVDSGSVVETMLSRMELYGEYITLKTGQVVIQAQNMSLDKNGNAWFSGDIIGGSINIGGKFIVDTAGKCYIAGSLTTETLNPPDGIYAEELEIYNDNDVINTVTGNIDCGDAYISEDLTCRRVYQTSDRRRKQDITPISEEAAAEALRAIIPAKYRFRDSQRSGIGCIAQEIYRNAGETLPMAARHEDCLVLPYGSYGAVYARMIQANQRRINALKQEVKRRKEETSVKL